MKKSTHMSIDLDTFEQEEKIKLKESRKKCCKKVFSIIFCIAIMTILSLTQLTIAIFKGQIELSNFICS